ncbi:MAG: thiamine pyrophosphate-dependent enzyme [Chloroflexota bacterium]
MGRNYTAQAIDQLNWGRGKQLKGDSGLIILKAMLENGVGYLGGYPGAPTSGLYDAISDAYQPVLAGMGIYFESSGNEAAAAALLQASVDHKVRGSVNWKVVGTNVAADVLAHIASSGVTGGVLIFVGEDYGLDSTTVAEKTLPYAQKSTMIVIDPKGDAAELVRMVDHGFAMSEASAMPAFFLLRTRVGNLRGTIDCRDNVEPALSAKHKVERLTVDRMRIPQPPQALAQEALKFSERIPAACRYIVDHQLNDLVEVSDSPIGIITHGQIYNTSIRALHTLGQAGLDGTPAFSILCLNVVNPLVPEQIVAFLQGKTDVLVVEEGMPAAIEEQVRAITQRNKLTTEIHGKGMLPVPGEYTPPVLVDGLARFLAAVQPPARQQVTAVAAAMSEHLSQARAAGDAPLPRRSPVFCTGCPERPIFSALKIAQQGENIPPAHFAGDIGCYSMGAFAPFGLTDSITGMGTGLATTGALGHISKERMVSFIGDGTFWHSGLTTSIGNAVYNNQDALMVVFENGWTSMTGQQENPTSGVNHRGEKVPRMDIRKALEAMGVGWIREVNPYKVHDTREVFKEALAGRKKGLKVIISKGECMLEYQRRYKKERARDLKAHRTVTDTKFGVDEDVCTGDHSCIRANGCPSLTMKDNPNPLKDDPIVTIANTCVGCGLCGEVAQTAVLCPSFYEARVTHNPSPGVRFKAAANRFLLRSMLGIAA